MLREIGGELVLLNNATDTYFGLNPTGAAMFGALTGGASFEQAVEELSNRFGVDAKTISADMSDLVGLLVDIGLLTVTSN